MSEKNELNANQKRAIAALLENPTIGEAAAACNLAERTIYRYLDEPQFRAELSRRESLSMDLATRRLLKMSEKALDALEDVLDYPLQKGATNMRLAAVAVINSLLKIRELRTIEQRLSELEKAVFDGSK